MSSALGWTACCALICMIMPRWPRRGWLPLFTHILLRWTAHRARGSSPSVIFFDEIDGMVAARDTGGDQGVSVGERMLSQLLQEMDGLQVCCVAALHVMVTMTDAPCCPCAPIVPGVACACVAVNCRGNCHRRN